MVTECVVRQIKLDREDFNVVGRLEGTHIAFWIERPPGKLWLRINEFDGNASTRHHNIECEIIASTRQDTHTLVKKLAKISGWFEFTGRTISYPPNQINEIWRLTSECLSELRPDIRSRTFPIIKSKECTEPGMNISHLVETLIKQIKPHGFSAMFILRPDPVRIKDRIAMTLCATSNEVLRENESILEEGLGYQAEMINTYKLDHENFAWSTTLHRVGYRSALVVRIPVGGILSYEFVFLSTTIQLQDVAVAFTAVQVMKDWSKWRRLIQREICNLTLRERESLVTAATGHTGASAAEIMGITERTYRLYTDTAKRKLNASSTAEAVYRANLLLLF